MIRENPASRGTETSAEELVGPPYGMVVSNAGQQQWYGGYPCTLDGGQVILTYLLTYCPQEGTRVRVLGLYHNTAWYDAVGHWGSGGRGSGVVIGERRSGIWQVVPEWVNNQR